MNTRIMVVEDEGIVAFNLQRRLISLGYEVPCIAASYEQAIRGARETNPDLVLMDINISGDIDGIDTAKELNRPVIYLTAYSEEKTLARAKETKPYGYLIKPFSERELHATIQMALERQQVEMRLIDSQKELGIAYEKIEEDNHRLMRQASELAQEKERLLVTMNSIGDGVITTDNFGRIEYLNPVAEKMTGWSIHQARGYPSSTIFALSAEDGNTIACSPIEYVLANGKACGIANNTVLKSKEGSEYLIEDSAAPICGADGTVFGVVLVFRDVSDVRRLANEMTFQATHDSLTGLVNRHEFEKRLGNAIENARQNPQHHALAYIDLDQFKIVNDTCGHIAGDELLRQITALLRLALRANDTLARLGGDEFGVLLDSCPLDIALAIAEKLRSIIEDFHFVWEDKTFPISASIGLVGFGSANASQLNLRDVLSIADSACYMAKDSGRNRVHVYQPDDLALNKRFGELDWYSRIYQALENNDFILYSQKIISLTDKHKYREHVEILLRLNYEGKIVPPMAFIPTAERYGLMTEIDRWVVRSAFQYISEHKSQNSSLFSVNLSGATINDEKTQIFIKEQFTRYGVNPKCICFEITETAAIANLTNARLFILALKDIGCQFALDDFGSGMSSFTYLKHFPVDYLKIDGGFVRDMVTDTIDQTFVAAINDIGHVMGVETIAEFAENEKILLKLAAMGVDYAQGYGIEHPVPFV